MSPSLGPSLPAMSTEAASPETRIPGDDPATVIRSAALVPLTMTLSGWPSPVCEPATPARSSLIRLTSVPVRSLTVTVSAPPRVLTPIPSTPSRSITMLPTSRVRRARWPLAETLMFSLALEPLKTSVSLPVWPSTVSLPSPGFQTNVSSPAPISAVSLPRPPVIVSLPSPPIRVSSPWLPTSASLPAPPSTVSRTTPAGRADALTLSLPPSVLRTSESLAPSEPVTATKADRPETAKPVPAPRRRRCCQRWCR